MPTLDYNFGTRRKLTREEFDPNDYLKVNQDVAQAGLDPWAHYETAGAADAFRPWSSTDMQAYQNRSTQPGLAPPPSPIDGAPREPVNPPSIPPTTPPTSPPVSPPPPPPPVVPPPAPPVNPPAPRGAVGQTPTGMFSPAPLDSPFLPPPPSPVAGPGAAPDYQALGAMDPAQRGPSYASTVNMGAAPDFLGLATLPAAQQGPGYTRTTGPGAAPDFRGIVDRMGAAPDFQALATLPEAQRGGGELEDLLTVFARNSLLTPSRWDQPLVQESLGVIDSGIRRNRDEGSRRISETLAARGVLGGTPEEIDLSYLESQLAEIEAARKNDLAREVANTTAADRTAASNIGLNVGQFSRGIDRDLEDDTRFRAGLGLEGAGMAEDATRFRTSAGLDAAGMGEDANRFRSLFDQTENQFGAGFNRQVGRDFRADAVTNATVGLQGAGMAEDASRFRAGFTEDANRFGATFNNTLDRQAEDDRRTRTGFGLDAAGMSEDALIARAMFGMQANNQLFNQGMARSAFGEDARRFGMGFNEDARRFGADFGLRDFLGRSGVAQQDRQFEEGVRQFDQMTEIEKWQFANQHGLARDQLDQVVRHQKQLETIAMLEYLEKTNQDFTVDPETGKIVPKGKKPEDDDWSDNKPVPTPVTAFKPGEYGSPKGPKEGAAWKDPSGRFWRFDGTQWVEDVTYT